MKHLMNKFSKRNKRFTIQFLALAIILFGICFTTINLVKYAKGYFANGTAFQYIQSDTNITLDQADNTQESTDEGKSNFIIKDTAKQTENEQVLYAKRPEIGDEIGELYIPKLDATLPIYHGTSEDELEKGVGHYVDSVLPGEKDNSVLSGHRDTVFRKLGEVGVGDLLIVQTSAGQFEYTVSKVRIVDKDDRTVIVPKPRATLTVSTCYPFEYIGSAPQRYILVAYLSSTTLN